MAPGGKRPAPRPPVRASVGVCGVAGDEGAGAVDNGVAGPRRVSARSAGLAPVMSGDVASRWPHRAQKAAVGSVSTPQAGQNGIRGFYRFEAREATGG
jgi:hypothetical protein